MYIQKKVWWLRDGGQLPVILKQSIDQNLSIVLSFPSERALKEYIKWSTNDEGLILTKISQTENSNNDVVMFES